MNQAFEELLNITIQYLRYLKSTGVEYVRVDRELLEALSKPLPAKTYTQPASTPFQPNIVKSQPTTAKETKPTAQVPESSSNNFTERTFDIMELEINATETNIKRLSTEEKITMLNALREQVLSCKKCPHLVAKRTNVVFGVGNVDAELMFVGEAPGEDEDLQGEPFVGKAGQLLTKIIIAMGLTREKVYIANILKCRPDNPDPKGNRPPTPEEIKMCFPYLQQQIKIIQPKVIVALGKTAVQGLLGEVVQITQYRGKWKSYRGIPVMPTYHPSYLLRNPSIIVKRQVWEDMLAVMEKLRMPISEKQRKYFT